MIPRPRSGPPLQFVVSRCTKTDPFVTRRAKSNPMSIKIKIFPIHESNPIVNGSGILVL
jgi:hypothetical protein